MAGKYVSPEFGITPFTCPHCETLAKQSFGELAESILPSLVRQSAFRGVGKRLYVSECEVCKQAVIWREVSGTTDQEIWDELSSLAYLSIQDDSVAAAAALENRVTKFEMLWPIRSDAPAACPDLPDEVLADYVEAQEVLPFSPRAAAALLRLALQRLCVSFGEPGKNISEDIGALVSKGTIRPMIQQAMDTVRISGNESVHPGELKIDDDRQLVTALFEFINLIAEEAISQPDRVHAMFQRMPESKKEGVAQRDAAAPKQS